MASKETKTTSRNKLSRLEKFTLDFEYDKTLRQIKKEIRHRTDRT